MILTLHCPCYQSHFKKMSLVRASIVVELIGLTSCGLVKPWDIRHIGQHWLGQWGANHCYTDDNLLTITPKTSFSEIGIKIQNIFNNTIRISPAKFPPFSPQYEDPHLTPTIDQVHQIHQMRTHMQSADELDHFSLEMVSGKKSILPFRTFRHRHKYRRQPVCSQLLVLHQSTNLFQTPHMAC